MPVMAPKAFPIEDAQTLVFQGDSLTDTERRGNHQPYGWGYVRMVIDLVTARYPQRKIAWHNRGTSGNTTDDLAKRWQDDCIALKPHWVSLMIGINDLHRYFNPNREAHVPPDKFRQNYETLLGRARQETGARFILMDPYYISNETEEGSQRRAVLKMLPSYIEVVREMADRFDAVHVPLHDVFQEHLKHRPADWFCPEPVHCRPSGHMVIAQAWLAAAAW